MYTKKYQLRRKTMVFEKVRELIIRELKVQPDKVVLDANLTDDLGADSIDAVEVIMAAEEEFKIQISDEDMKSAKTIGDLVNIIEKKVK
ncbi:MAG: acyl carrier protein [Acholeplasmatales bacterium]|nr:acyl carrier protein [Acholeplasmatales bacterium]